MSEGPVAGEPVDLQAIADALEGAGEHLRSRNDHLERMSAAIAALVVSTEALIRAVAHATRRNWQFRLLMGGMVIIALIGIAALVAGVIRLNGIADTNRANNRLIASCVTAAPTHGCYRDQQARLVAQTIVVEQDLRTDAAAAAWCARKPHIVSYRQMTRCVSELTDR